MSARLASGNDYTYRYAGRRRDFRSTQRIHDKSRLRRHSKKIKFHRGGNKGNSQEKMKKKVFVILGQTATGKSDLAVKLAKKLDGEIISADSRQVYRGLDIGTGKITKKEMRNVPHHLLDVVDPRKQFSVSQYKKMAEEELSYIEKRGKTA